MLDISWSPVGHAAVRALVLLVSNPLLYIGWLLYALALGQEAKHQRRFFGVRLTRVRTALWAGVWRSLVAGTVLSVCSCVLGVIIRPWDGLFLSALLIVLGVARLRLASAPTAIGLMVMLTCAAKAWRPGGMPAALASLWHHVATIPIYAWLSMAALLCLTEALLMFTRVRRVSHPVLLESKRGRVIGAVSVQLMYVVPVIVSVTGSIPRPDVPASWPWLGEWAGGLGFIGLPFFLGMGGMFTSVKARYAVRTAAWHAASMGVLIGGAAALAHWYPSYGWVGGILALFGRESLVAVYRRWETQREPMYVQSAKGVRLLDVVGGSLAETIGFQAGEVITHLNQVPVHSEYDLHFAYSQNPAYAKLQVLDERGEVRIVGGAVYDGERAKLGVVGAPDGLTGESYARSQFGLLQNLYVRMNRELTAPEESVDSPMGT